MARAVCPGGLEREQDTTVGQQPESILSDRRTEQITAELFQTPAIAAGTARRLTLLPGAFLARRIAQGDLAAGLLRQEALVMDAARDQVSALVAQPHLLRDALAIAPPVAIGHPRAAAQNLSNARRRMDLPFLTPPQVAEQVVEIPALELAVRLLVDDHRSHRSAKGRCGRVPGVRFVEPLDVMLDHLVGDRQLERAEILARVHVSRHDECNPPWSCSYACACPHPDTANT